MTTDRPFTAQKLKPLLWTALALVASLGSIISMASGTPILAFFPAVLILALFALAYSPLWFIYGLIFMFPLGAVRHLPGPLASIQLHWLFAAGLLAAFAAYMLINPSLISRLRANIWFAYALYLFFALLSAFISPYQTEALTQALLIFVGMILVALMIVFLNRKAIVVWIPWVIVSAITISACVALIEYHLGYYIVGSPDTTGYRAQGLTPDPNVFAMSLLFATPFLAYKITEARKPVPKLLSLCLMTIIGVAMIATSSRSGALMLALTTILLLLANGRSLINPRYLGLLLLGSVLFLGALTVSLPQEFWERQATLMADEKDNSISRRGAYVIVGARVFVERPVLGHGLGAFKYIFAGTPEAVQFDAGNVHDRIRDAHNTYLEIIVGTGLLGLGAFVLLIYIAVRNYIVGYRLLKTAGELSEAKLLLHYLFAFVVLLFYLVFLSDVHQKYILLMLAASVVWRREAEKMIRYPLSSGLERRLR